jgi:hypothetical protein
VIYLVVLLAGLLVGLAVGRWPALLAALGFGIWIGFQSEVDVVPSWFLGLGFGGVAALGVTAGVLARRRI